MDILLNWIKIIMNQKNLLWFGDSLEQMKRIQNKSIDLICCDLPYGTTACNWDVIIPFDKLWAEYKRISKDKGIIVLFGSEPFSTLMRASNLEWYKYDWIWEKNNAGNFQLVKYQPLKIHETISVFYNETPNMQFSEIMHHHMERLNLKQIDISRLQLSKNGNITGWVTNKLNGTQLPTRDQWAKICNLFKIDNEYDIILKSIPKITYNLYLNDVNIVCNNKGKAGNLGHMSSENNRDSYIQTKTGYPKSILKYNRENKWHPTQKPLDLIKFLIKTYSNKGEWILDNTCGSDTTGIASFELGRNSISIENDLDIYNIAKKRRKQYKIPD